MVPLGIETTHLVAYDQGFEDGRLLMIYGPIYDHGGGAHGHFEEDLEDVLGTLTLSCMHNA